MVAVFIYSKRYGDQGPPISNPKSTEHFSVSVPLGNGKFATRQASLSRMADMQIKYIRGNGFNFQSNNGLMGNGLESNPLKIDVNWVEANFVNSKYWQFSQIGDPTDTDLTISGSYFSVNYPYGSDHYSSTSFVEGNGDLRILRHVTNGEDFRVTYATWKNYRKTNIGTMRITDNVYAPPGLASDEYIHNVYQMSSRAMLAEIWSGVTFKEFVFITLNGTAVDEYHTLLRLGANVADVFTGFGANNALTRRRCFRSSNIIATILNGRKFLVCVLPPGTDGACKTQVAEVHANGYVALVEGFTVETSLGVRTNDWSTQIFFNKVVSYDPNDKDRCFYFSDPNINYGSQGTSISPSPFIKISGQELPGEKLGIMFHMYAACQYKNFYSGPCKAQYFYIMDIATKSVYPEPETGYNRLYQVDVNASLNGYVMNGPLTYGRTEHYYSQGRNYQLLPSGDRIRFDQSAGGTDVIPQVHLYSGSGNSITQAMSDRYFDTEWITTSKNLVLQPPTPVQAICAGLLVHGNLLTTTASTIGGTEPASGAWSKLIGNYTDKNYKLLNSDSSSFLAVTGYNLSPERGSINFSLAINTFRSKTGELYYHNACWSRYGNAAKVCDSTIDANLTVRGKYTFDAAIRTKMDNAILSYFETNKPAGFTEIHNMNWLLIPAHMSIARDHAIYKISISFKVPDPTDPQGYRFTGTYMFGGIIGATINVNGDGDCRFIDVNTGMLRFNQLTLITTNYNIGGDEGRFRLNTATMYKASTIDIVLGGGFGSSVPAGSNHNGWVPHGIKTDYQNTDPTVIRFTGEILDKVAIHKTLGLGFISNGYGMGAMYVFRLLNEETLLPDATRGGPYVLGSARPAAGFSLTVSAPVEIYNQGLTHILPIQTYDLTKVNPNSTTAHKNAHFYMYAILANGNASLKVTYDPLPEHNAQLFLGHIKTSDTEITSIIAETKSRWEVARPSVDPIGGALPVATGVPSSLGVDSIWENHELQSDTAAEYLWDADDLYDTDGNYETVVVDSYWSTNSAGSDRVSQGAFSQNLWFIMKTKGPATSLQVNLNSPSFDANTFEVGTVENWVNIGLNPQSDGTKMGSYQIRLEDEFEMSFKNARYQNVTAKRAVNTDYVNDTGKLIAIAITIHNSDDHNQCQFLVEGEMVGFSDGYQSSGTGHWYPQIYAIIPPGQKYRLNGRPQHIGMWSELRPPL